MHLDRQTPRLPGKGTWILRVAHINDIAFVASDLVRAQRCSGIEAVLFDPGKPGGLLGYPMKLLTLPFRLWPVLRVVRSLRRGRFDVIHVHYATHGLIGFLAGAPFVLHCHGTDVRYIDRRSPRGRYLAWVMGRASAVVYATPDLEAWVRPFRADAQFIPNPIDVERFQPGQPPDRDVLLGVRLDPIKGAQIAIDAIALLLERRPTTTITVVDDGPLAGEALERLGGRAEIVPVRSHDQMSALFGRHRLAVGQFRLGILSQYELEAMACGVPVVSAFMYPSAYDWPPPALHAESASAAATVLDETLTDPARLAILAVQSRAWVTAHHRAEAVAEKVSTVYGHALREIQTR